MSTAPHQESRRCLLQQPFRGPAPTMHGTANRPISEVSEHTTAREVPLIKWALRQLRQSLTGVN